MRKCFKIQSKILIIRPKIKVVGEINLKYVAFIFHLIVIFFRKILNLDYLFVLLIIGRVTIP